jgi:RNA polymerase sigma-70 factor (ECF subfamily)
MVCCNTNTLRLAAFSGRTETGFVESGAVGPCGSLRYGTAEAFNLVSQKRTPFLGLIGSNPAGSRHKEKTEPLSDAEVIRRVLEGDVDSFEHLLNRHRSRVFGIVSRHVPPDEVEELAHDVFIRAFKSLSTFRHESNFRNWLSSIAVRACHDYWRGRYRSREIAISGLSQPHQKWLEHVIAEESSSSFADEINRKEAGEILKWALDHLQPKDRAVLELLYFQEYSIKEAAATLGWTQATVKVRSFRARQKLRKILKDVMKPDSEVL